MRCVWCAAVWMSGHRTAHGGMCGAPRRAYGVGCTALFCYIFSVCWLLLNAVVPFRFSGAGGAACTGFMRRCVPHSGGRMSGLGTGPNSRTEQNRACMSS